MTTLTLPAVLILTLLLLAPIVPTDAGRISSGFFHDLSGLLHTHRTQGGTQDGLASGAAPPIDDLRPDVCDLCADNWLFVLAAGGRTGSTTAMSMFNSVPGFEIGGEHMAVLDAEQDYLQHVVQTERAKGLAFQHRPHDLHALRCSMQDRMKRLVFGTDFEQLAREVRVLGFKEIRYLTLDKMAFIASVFPCARFVFTYRNETETAVRADGFQHVDLPRLWNQAGMLYKHLANEFPQQMDMLAVENLTTERYNTILHELLGVEGCLFTKIFHENAGGGYTRNDSHPVKRAGVLIDGDCDFSGVDFRLPAEAQARNAERWEALLQESKAHNKWQNHDETGQKNGNHL